MPSPRPFRGILGAALLLAGLGPDLQPPPRPREPEEPEPTTDELDAMHAALTAAGIDAGRLAADVRGWPREFMRRGRIELAARDLTAAGVGDIDRNRAALEQATGLTYAENLALLERVRARAVALGESVFTVRQLREAGVTVTPGLPDDMQLRVGAGLTISRDGIPVVELGEIERNIRPVGPALWTKARAVLPALPEVMPPETALPRSITGTEPLVFNVDASLHPAGRCTCGAGGGDAGTCEWCVMDRHREDRVARKPARKREVRRAKSARKARRGW